MSAGYGQGMAAHVSPSDAPLGSVGAPIELVIADVPATAARAGAVRHSVASWLEAAGIEVRRRSDVELAVYEALANTVEHAYRGAETAGTFTVHGAYSPHEHRLEISVVDHGRWRPPTPNPLRGNGLTLISAVASDAAVAHRIREPPSSCAGTDHPTPPASGRGRRRRELR